jgi:hypothetical protein
MDFNNLIISESINIKILSFYFLQLSIGRFYPAPSVRLRVLNGI